MYRNIWRSLQSHCCVLALNPISIDKNINIIKELITTTVISFSWDITKFFTAYSGKWTCWTSTYMVYTFYVLTSYRQWVLKATWLRIEEINRKNTCHKEPICSCCSLYIFFSEATDVFIPEFLWLPNEFHLFHEYLHSLVVKKRNKEKT